MDMTWYDPAGLLLLGCHTHAPEQMWEVHMEAQGKLAHQLLIQYKLTADRKAILSPYMHWKKQNSQTEQPWDPKTFEIADTLEKTNFSQKSRTFGNQLFSRLGKIYQHTIRCETES